MPLDLARTRQLLANFDFKNLFIEELGWNRHDMRLEVIIDSQPFSLTAVAEKRGMVAFIGAPNAQGKVPDYALRRKIERQTAKSAHEHLIIFTDSAKTTQVWQWVKRQPGKPSACREHQYHRDQPGDSLIQKLQALVFFLEEEEQLTIVDVTGRARRAFDVEKVTKRFYDRFKTEHDTFLKFLAGIPDEEMQRWYVSVMLNRLMFIYFIQRKGFLDGDANYLRHKMEDSKCRGKDRFYGDFLCPLFFEGFAKRPQNRSAETNRLLGKVPYLNGGIFMPHQIEQIHGREIEILDRAFEKLFEFFDAYQWHLDDRPTRNDNEIRPDVLGYIFEKYINQKQMGAYYTKEDITEYISKNTVVPFLFGKAKERCKVAFEGQQSVWRLLRENPDRYIYPAVRSGVIDEQGQLIPESSLPDFVQKGMHDPKERMFNRDYNLGKAFVSGKDGRDLSLPTETWREYVERRKRCLQLRQKLANGEVRDINDLITYNLDIRQFAQDVIENSEGPELIRAFWRALNEITILDPACGSGAFLFAALNILEPLYEACLDRMRIFVDELDRSGQKHDPKKFADFREVLKRTSEHPNEKYFILKSIVVNNLFGVDIMDEAVEICKLRLFLKLVAQIDQVEYIEPLPDIDFNIRAGNTLVGFTSLEEIRATLGKLPLGFAEQKKDIARIEEEAEIADRAFQQFRKQQTELGGTVTAEDKRNLAARLGKLAAELDRYLAGEYKIDAEEQKDAFTKWRASHKPFHWFAEFYGIMKHGGFDVIIGNPPYVEYHTIKRDYQIKGYATEPCGNLYAYMVERCFSLAGSESRIGVIVQLSAICTDRMEPLQREYLSRTRILWSSCYDDRPGKLFEGLEHIRATILLSLTGAAQGAEILTTNLARWPSESRGYLFSLIRYGPVTQINLSGSFPKAGHPDLGAVLHKVRALPHRLESSHDSSSLSAVYYYRSPLYWIRAMDFLPYFSSDSAERSIHHFKDFQVSESWWAPIVGCIINSTIFYIWFVSYGNGRNVAIRDIVTFPVPEGLMNPQVSPAFNRLFARLMADFKEKSVIRKRRDGVEYQEFYPGKSKPIIDEIDRVLAKHYGFTDEELDFIINYDIKYRLGQEAIEDGEE
jgi:hypothetical protein